MGSAGQLEPLGKVVPGERHRGLASECRCVLGVDEERRVIRAVGSLVEARVAGLTRALVVGVAERNADRCVAGIARGGRAQPGDHLGGFGSRLDLGVATPSELRERGRG